jgi:hypothetical protein
MPNRKTSEEYFMSKIVNNHITTKPFLENINNSQLLENINNSQQYIQNQIVNTIESQTIQQVEQVFVPPDIGELTLISSGENPYISPGIIPRLEYLEEALAALGIDLYNDCLIYRAKNSSKMIRGKSYILIIVPAEKVKVILESNNDDTSIAKERMILICEEEGNRTFVIEKTGEKEQEYMDNNSSVNNEYQFYTDKTKLELKELTNVAHFEWKDEATWKQQIQAILSRKTIEAKTNRRMWEYYENQENISYDLWAYTRAAGLEHPSDLKTSNISLKFKVECSNGDKVLGNTYLIAASRAAGYTAEEAQGLKAQILEDLKERAGFST